MAKKKSKMAKKSKIAVFKTHFYIKKESLHDQVFAVFKGHMIKASFPLYPLQDPLKNRSIMEGPP